MRWFRQQTAETLRNVNLRVLLVLLILLPPAMRGVSGTIEIKTHLSTQLPPDKGAPVCLAGSTKPIGAPGLAPSARDTTLARSR